MFGQLLEEIGKRGRTVVPHKGLITELDLFECGANGSKKLTALARQTYLPIQLNLDLQHPVIPVLSLHTLL